jgi:nucleoside-diphosphate-sugar epimerase
MTSALITGATGYIGSRLAHHLVQAGWRVSALVRSGSDRTRLPADIRWLSIDGTAESVHDAVLVASPQIVFHLAGFGRAEHDPASLDAVIDSNLKFGAQILDAIAHSGCAMLIRSGTYWEYNSQGQYRPNSLYAAAKHAFRTISQYYAGAYGLRVVDLILYDVYGPGDWRGKFLPQLLGALARNEPFGATPGDQLLDLVHVQDVVAAFEHAAKLIGNESDATNGIQTFRVDTGRRLKLREVADMAAAIMNLKDVPIRWGAREYPAHQVMQPLSVGPRLPGWTSNITLEQGLAELVAEQRGECTQS